MKRPELHLRQRQHRSPVLRCMAFAVTLMLLAPLTARAESIFPDAITLATHDLFPYGSYRDNGQFQGIAVDRLQCAFHRLGVVLKLEVMPWARAEAAFMNNTVDGFFAASRNALRDRHGVHSVQIAEQTWQWFLMADNRWAPDRPGFREHALVTSFLGANMQQYLEDEGYQLVSPPLNTEALAAMLISGRIDAALANNLVMTAILQQHYPDAAVISYVLQEKPLFTYFGNAFATQHPAFLPAFNRAIEACQFGLPGNSVSQQN